MSENTPFEKWWKDSGQAHLFASDKDMAWEAWIAALRHCRDGLNSDIDAEGPAIAKAAWEAA